MEGKRSSRQQEHRVSIQPEIQAEQLEGGAGLQFVD